MNFNQWRGHASKKDVAKVTYVCGEVSLLVELVIADIKGILDVPVTDYIELDGTTNFWDIASYVPLDADANRLVVVRKAELITNWEPLYAWYAAVKGNPKNYLVFASYETDAPATYAKGRKVEYHDHIEFIRSKGMLVRCSQPNETDLITWAKSFGLSEEAATFLVGRVASNVSALHAVLKKVHIWNGSPNTKALSLLCDELALDSLADYIMRRDKASALRALAIMTDAERYFIPVLLSRQLDTLVQISSYVKRRVYAVDIANTTGIKLYTVKKLTPLVREYDIQKIQYCRQLLVMVDSIARQGAKVGVWETLISLW